MIEVKLINNSEQRNDIFFTFLKEYKKFITDLNIEGLGFKHIDSYVIINADLSQHTQANPISDKLYFLYSYSSLPKSVDKNSIESKFNALQLILLRSTIPLKDKICNIFFLWNMSNDLIVDNSEIRHAESAPKENAENMDYIAVVPKYKLEDVIMPESVQKQINRAIVLIKNRKKIYEQWGYSNIDPYTKAVLCFYGEPGTGKTMCAHALTKALDEDKKILIASYANIESKWVGEGPKNLRAIFEAATQQDAVLFFDEADSFLSKRAENTESSSDKHYNRMSNEMFQLLENFDGIVIFATNLVSDFDKGFKSRILSHVEFIMPDEESRIKLITSMLNKLNITLSLSDDKLRELSKIADGFSGRDIRKAFLITLTNVAIKDLQSFDYEDFEKSFSELKTENEALTKEMKTSKSGVNENLIKEFVDLTNENKTIMCLCLHAAWLNGKPTSEIAYKLTEISKILKTPIPDTSNNAYLPDLGNLIKQMITSERKLEAIRYMMELLALSSLIIGEKKKYLEKICCALEVVQGGIESISDYFETKQKESDLLRVIEKEFFNAKIQYNE